MKSFNTRKQFVSLLLLQCICLIFFIISVSEAAETVKLQLKWKHQFQFAGYYAAIEQGYYAEEGLNVTLIEGKPGGNEVEEVLSGRADIGVGMSDILLARLKGKPVVVLANIFQHSPVILLTTQKSGYIFPHDLFQHKVGMAIGEKSVELQAMFVNEGVSLDDITLLKPSWNLDNLIQGKVDAVAAYISSQPYLLKMRNVPYTVISPTTYGIDFYGDNLFTSESEIAEHPERVASFTKASLKGWEYALKNPEEIIELILSKYIGDKKNLTREFLRNEAAAYQKLILPEFVAIGHMNPGRWKHIADTYVKLGMVDKKYSLDGLLFNPSPAQFDWGHWVVKWGLGLIIVAFGSTLFFMFFTRRLKREIYEHKKTEKALRESEERFRVLYEYAPLPYQSLDENGYLIEVNNTWLELTGYEKDEVIGKSFADFLHPDWVDHFKENFPKFKSIGEVLGVEFELQKKDGNFIRVIFDGKIRRDQVGAFIQTHCVFNDVTDQRQTEKKLKEQEAVIQQAQKMEAIGTLAGGIAHDFNNILGIILGYTEMAKEDAVPGTNQEKDLENVLAGAERAKNLVQQILAFSRQSQLDPTPIEIQPLIKEGLKMLRSSIPTTISITEDIDSQGGIVVVDPTHVHQILMNLGTNAYHAMEESGGVLSVTLKSTFIEPGEKEILLHVSSGEYLELTVSDTGGGIGPDVIEKIFDPYFTTKEIGKGTGMGLAIIHGIAKDFGGTITVESQLGKGTTFYVYLPIVKEDALPEKEEREDIPQGTERILFIDDEQLLAEMGKVMLERLGYHVTVRHSSLEALETFQNTPNAFDLVITDQTMHGMTGSDLARRMMQIRPDIPIILCTGYSNLIDEESAKTIGIKEFALKPLAKEVIAKLIRKVLKRTV